MKRSKARKTIVFLAAAGLLIAAAGAFGPSARTSVLSDGTTVANVNGEPIAAAELRRELNRQRSAVIDYFRRTYDADLDAGFWQTDFDGEVPAETARQWALEAAVRTKLQLMLAESFGIVPGVSRDELLEEMERENARRKEARKAGLPVYGPVRFDESEFYDFYLGRVTAELKEKLAEGELAATDEQLKRHYDRIKDELFRLEDSVTFRLLSVSYLKDGQRIDDELKRQAEEAARSARRRLERNEAIETIAREMAEDRSGPVARVTEERFGGESARYYYKALPELYEWLNDRASGRIGPVIDDGAQGRFVLAVAIEREEGGYRSFEEQKENVRRHEMDARFAEYLDRLADEADVTTVGEFFGQLAPASS